MEGGKYIDRVFLNREIDPKSYLYRLPAVRHLSGGKALQFLRDVTFFVGENGAGKSTILEAIAIAYGFNAEGGTKNFNFSTNATHSELWEHLTISRSRYAKDGFFLRAESFYNVATNIDALGVDGSYGRASLHTKSHGESFMALVQNRFGGNGLYILDEPEAALSPTRLMTLLAEIHDLVQRGSQFIIATHSPILMAYPGACIYEFSEDGICPVEYTQTEHYQVTRRFLENPEQMLRYLLEKN